MEGYLSVFTSNLAGRKHINLLLLLKKSNKAGLIEHFDIAFCSNTETYILQLNLF